MIRRQNMPLTMAVLLGLLAPLLALAQAESQPASGPTTTAAAQSRPATTTAATSRAAEKKKDRYLAVIDGRVHTVTGPVLEKATVLCKNGVIVAIGEHVQLPPECEVIDASGKYVYPGLIAVQAGGIHGGSNPQDTTNVFGLTMGIALAGGITTAASGNTAAKLTFGTTEGLVLRDDLFMHLSYSSRQPLQRAKLRADLERVRGYLRDQRKYEQQKKHDEKAKPPDKDWLKGNYEKYRKLLEHEAVAVCDARQAQELRDIAELATDFDFDLVVRGAREGWVVPGVLGRAGAKAIVTPREERDPDLRANRPTGASIENARILRDHGVTVAVVPSTASITLWGLAGRDLLHLNMEAAFAVRGGLSNADALKTVTIDAARVLGVDDRVGSLEVGKDADIVVCDGDLLHYMTQVHYTIVNGRVAYDKSKETLFAHIRPDGKPRVPQFDDQWPRRLTWPE